MAGHDAVIMMADLQGFALIALIVLQWNANFLIFFWRIFWMFLDLCLDFHSLNTSRTLVSGSVSGRHLVVQPPIVNTYRLHIVSISALEKVIMLHGSNVLL